MAGIALLQEQRAAALRRAARSRENDGADRFADRTSPQFNPLLAAALSRKATPESHHCMDHRYRDGVSTPSSGHHHIASSSLDIAAGYVNRRTAGPPQPLRDAPGNVMSGHAGLNAIASSGSSRRVGGKDWSHHDDPTKGVAGSETAPLSLSNGSLRVGGTQASENTFVTDKASLTISHVSKAVVAAPTTGHDRRAGALGTPPPAAAGHVAGSTGSGISLRPSRVVDSAAATASRAAPPPPAPPLQDINSVPLKAPGASALPDFLHADETANPEYAVAATGESQHECRQCGRRFVALDKLERHAKSCVESKPRAKFDVAARRVAAIAETAGVDGHGGLTTAPNAEASRQRNAAKHKAKWRDQSAQLQAVMSAARKGETAPPMAAVADDRVECRGCGKKFAEDTHRRHEPKCIERSGAGRK